MIETEIVEEGQSFQNPLNESIATLCQVLESSIPITREGETQFVATIDSVKNREKIEKKLLELVDKL